MTISGQHTTVLIVGAGPSGLMMAAQLLRSGVTPLIIDSGTGPTQFSKALVVQARSMEIYRQMGIVDKVLVGGKPAGRFSFCDKGGEKIGLDLNSIEDAGTLYPYLFVYPQSSNERVLLDYLTLNCCPVYWNTTLAALSQTKEIATATVVSDGETQTITADWVIGADGSHSAVRKNLDIPFNGDTYKHLFYLIDCQLDDRIDSDTIKVYLSKQGLCGFFPMPGANNYRIIGNLPSGIKTDNVDLQLNDLLPLIKKTTGTAINIKACNWIIAYKLHHRMADSFRVNRCFLIGDAAHIHSPVGGQGMNTGLQDAYNLAWKLALVINKKCGGALLESYAAERMPVAKTLLTYTDRAFNLAISQNFFAQTFRLHILPRLLRMLWQKERIKRLFFKALSQTGISYRDSQINLHLSQGKQIKAGDRLPYLKVFDEKKQEETDLHRWCFKPGFTLIILGKLIEEDLFKVAKWLTHTYGSAINFYYLPPSAKNLPVFEVFEVGKGQHRSILVRPDMHIGFMNDAIDPGRMDKYLREYISFQAV
jgi:2-polyprenyl-6-methoxyphenol hydroxylase-like FAD-dependent oxidoreductase